MKVYILSDSDFAKLLLKIDRDPRHGREGGSSTGHRTTAQQVLWDEAHGFYNYQLRTWIDEMKKEQ